ncbi:RIP metalloprotease RseP [bacterium F16]|nr:RIP metalloprotease RseP [bacterium F16]
MNGILSQAISVILVIFFFGFCVFIHEFGHLLAAMWRKLHIECFSIGFGKPIWKTMIKGVEYRISWIPFGGYVALPQLEPTDKPQTSDGKALPEAKPIDRIITAFAGPFFNIIFGFLLGGVVWFCGMPQQKKEATIKVGFLPSTYEYDGETNVVPEFNGGLRLGDVIVAVNGIELKDGMNEARQLILTAEGARVELDVLRNGTPLKVTYKAAPHPNPNFRGAGVPMFDQYHATKIAQLKDDSPAYKAGLRDDDVMVSVNGETVWGVRWVLSTLEELNKDTKPGETPEAATFEVKRNGELLTPISVTPEWMQPSKENELKKPTLMFGLPPRPIIEMSDELKRPLPWEQFSHTVMMMGRTLKMISDKDNPVKLQALSGPVGIFNMMKQMFDSGYVQGLYLTVIISFSLAMFNLLPLPILDGGHIVLAVVEGIFRRKIPTKVVQPVFYAFFAVIISFALYVTFFDVRQIVKGAYYLRQTTTKEDAKVIQALSEKTNTLDAYAPKADVKTGESSGKAK